LNSLSVQEQRKSELKRIKKAYALEVSHVFLYRPASAITGKLEKL